MSGVEQIEKESAKLVSGATATIEGRCVNNILLVEDERLVREVSGEVLRSAGYTVWKAESAVEATRLFEKRGADIGLLITDVVLTDGRGPELARKLRALGGRFRTILISGYPERMIAKNSLSDCFYLEKPFSAHGLTSKVFEVLHLAPKA